MTTPTPPLPLEVGAGQVIELREHDDEFLLLDCRERDEHAFVSIPGSTLLPMGEIAGRVGELDEHRHRRIVVYCHHGMRSLRVVQWMRQQGFAQAQSMAGGIDGWSIDVDPELPRY
jgi:rhodanese-related sulfurtransferase